jgi:energy-coupling factor transporter ATP-binding protein EcfA2
MEVDFGDGQSLAVYGDNGTGKSTIADALEWFFTGGIELLSHEGRQHAIKNLGPAGGEGETSVELVTSGDLGGKAVYPDERGPESFAAWSRETFLLRGRTLADFINKSKTEKWKALAELLGLDAVELLRQDLQRARSDIKKQVKAAEERIEIAARALGSPDGKLAEDSVLQSLQQICRGLGVDVPDSLDTVCDPAWIAEIARGGESASAGKVEALARAVAGLGPVPFDPGPIRAWNDCLASENASELSRLALFKDADALFASSPAPERCPLCSQAVDGKKLSLEVRELLGSLLEASRELERAGEAAESSVESLAAAAETRRGILAQAKALRMNLAAVPSVPAFDSRSPIDAALLESAVSDIESWDRAAREEVAKSAPVSSGNRGAQLGMLAALAEQVRLWRGAQKELARAQKAYDLADRIYDAYQDRQKEQLEEMLKSISAKVAELYAALHPGEELGGITVEPWTAKGLELAVDFHGSRQRPPHGVLSESHLNSLAIALFLAMAQTFNRKLRFLVLDDVINSFDLEHRGQLAELLAERFDDWQIIVLTHDRQFFEHLSRRAPSWKRLEITSWSYDEGPRTTRYDSSGILADASARLAEGDVNGAATKARRALEELLQEVCEALRAELPFRRGAGNDQREIGELLKGIRRGVKEHAKGMLSELEPLLKNLEADVQASLNVEAHASRGRAAASEVEAALGRIEKLDRLWSCPKCGTRVWHKGTPDSSRCKCGKSLFPPPPS